MPWKGVTVSEQRKRFLEDYLLNYYSISELADRFSVSRTTAHKWIKRYREYGQSGYHEHSRRPRSCPWQTDAAIVEEVDGLRKAHPRWGPSKLLDLMDRRDPRRGLPATWPGSPSSPCRSSSDETTQRVVPGVRTEHAEADRAIRLPGALPGAAGKPGGNDPDASPADLCQQYPAAGLRGAGAGGRGRSATTRCRRTGSRPSCRGWG